MSIWHLIPVGIIGAGLFFGVLYAVLRGGKHNDIGLLKTPEGKLIRWDTSAPLISIYFAADLNAIYMNHCVVAIREIEDKVGRPLFMMPQQAIPELEAIARNEQGTGLKGSVFICDDNGDDPNHGHTSLKWDTRTGYVISAVVQLPEAHVTEHGYGIVLHEMMHVLGFGHDGTPESIMWPHVQARPGHITGADSKRLREYYGSAA